MAHLSTATCNSRPLWFLVAVPSHMAVDHEPADEKRASSLCLRAQDLFLEDAFFFSFFAPSSEALKKTTNAHTSARPPASLSLSLSISRSLSLLICLTFMNFVWCFKNKPLKGFSCQDFFISSRLSTQASRASEANNTRTSELWVTLGEKVHLILCCNHTLQEHAGRLVKRKKGGGVLNH